MITGYISYDNIELTVSILNIYKFMANLTWNWFFLMKVKNGLSGLFVSC